MRPLLYVCAPFHRASLDEARSRDAAISVALTKGWAPIFAPYLYDKLLADAVDRDREVAFDCDRSIIDRCDAFLIVGERMSEGMSRDYNHWVYGADRAAEVDPARCGERLGLIHRCFPGAIPFAPGAERGLAL